MRLAGPDTKPGIGRWQRVLATAFIALLALSPLVSAGAEGAAMATTQRIIRDKFPDVPQVPTTTLAEWLQHEDGPVLVDVREPEEYAVSHLAGARRASSLEGAVAALADTPRNQRIVVYCSVGYRSSKLARELRAAGYENVHNLEGSIFEWANEGRPVYRNGQAVREVHPYNWFWGRLLAPELRTR